MDVGGKYAGTLAGSMNMMGNLAGFVAPWLGGYILLQTHDNWNVLLYAMAGVYLLGTLCWPFIDPVTALDSRDNLEAAAVVASPQGPARVAVPAPLEKSLD
jgi:hypothetical protein